MCLLWGQKRQRVDTSYDVRRNTVPARTDEVALVVYLYTFGWNFLHPKDTRHCKDLLPYDDGALKFLEDLDMQVNPSPRY